MKKNVWLNVNNELLFHSDVVEVAGTKVMDVVSLW